MLRYGCFEVSWCKCFYYLLSQTCPCFHSRVPVPQVSEWGVVRRFGDETGACDHGAGANEGDDRDRVSPGRDALSARLLPQQQLRGAALLGSPSAQVLQNNPTGTFVFC